jgi:hypothetical protein
VLVQADGTSPASASGELFLPSISLFETFVGYAFACLAAIPKGDGDIRLTTVVDGQRRAGGDFTGYLRGGRRVSVD